jgi:hypothetical protein
MIRYLLALNGEVVVIVLIPTNGVKQGCSLLPALFDGHYAEEMYKMESQRK